MKIGLFRPVAGGTEQPVTPHKNLVRMSAGVGPRRGRRALLAATSGRFLAVQDLPHAIAAWTNPSALLYVRFRCDDIALSP